MKSIVENLNIGLESSKREKIAMHLFGLLADENVLYTKLKNYHWNIVGETFVQHHAFLDDLASSVYENIDEVAERMRSLGVKVNASLAEYLKHSEIEEADDSVVGYKEIFKNLLGDFELGIRKLRDVVEVCENEGDAGTADFLTGIMEVKEKKAWMIRSIIN